MMEEYVNHCRRSSQAQKADSDSVRLRLALPQPAEEMKGSRFSSGQHSNHGA